MLVSVIIPCYNVEAFVEECLDSVLNQSYSEIEIICIDNNSTDNTFSIISKYACDFPDKIIVLSERHSGASFARNLGLYHAKGKWIQFLDADDLLSPEKIAHQVTYLLQNEQADFIAASFFKQRINGNIEEFILEKSDPFKALFVTKLGNTCANLFRTSSVRDIGGWNTDLKSSQETDLMFRLLQNKTVVLFDNLPFTKIRERESGQISQSDPNKNWIQYIELRFAILVYLKNNCSDYFEIEKGFYYQKLFLQLKKMASFDLNRAQILYDTYFEKDYSPFNSSILNAFFNLIGFKAFMMMNNLRR
jgi:glycosyltransferase involved in cell wall biosynthesis